MGNLLSKKWRTVFASSVSKKILVPFLFVSHITLSKYCRKSAMFVKQTSGFVAMKFVNFIAHYIMGEKKLKSLSARCSLIGYGNCFALGPQKKEHNYFLCKKHTWST